MVIILIHWMIKHGYEQNFLDTWNSMSIDTDSGFYKESLATPVDGAGDPRYQTFSIQSPHYTTYINIGSWSSLGHFEKAIQKYFPVNRASTDGKQIIEMEDFEFKLRERIVLRVVSERNPKEHNNSKSS